MNILHSNRAVVVMLLLASSPLVSFAQDIGPQPLLLWPGGAPGKAGDEPADKPELRVYLPAKDAATGTGVVICPGGGYGALATDHEGHQVAKWLNSIGVAGFVLKYRLGPRYRHPAPLQDVQRAIRHVRAKAEEYGVDAQRIGVMGFSAGGHLASTAATHFDKGNSADEEVTNRQSCRPDFAILAYPVISLQSEFTHRGSVRNLLGESPDPALLDLLSNEKQVTKETPPVFLFHTGEDTGVPVENSLAFYQACRKAGVPAELHVYQKGPHGVGLAPADPVTTTWKDRLRDWLKTNGLLASVQRSAIEGVVRIGGKPLRWGMIAFVPSDSKNKPIAFAMVGNGNFKIAESSGPSIGPCKIEIHDLGSVEPRPTIDETRRLDKGDHAVNIESDGNKISVEVDSSR